MKKLQITKPLTEEIKEVIVRGAEEFFQNQAHGFSIKNFFTNVEYNNQTTWSYMKNRNWNAVKTTKGDKDHYSQIHDRVFISLAKAVGFEFSGVYWKHFDTDNFMAICNHLQDIRHMKLAGLIDGLTGTGKTYSIERYRRQFPSNTFVITCAGDMSVKDFVCEITDVLGLTTNGTKVELRKRIVRFLSRKQDPILIFDECENLKEGSYDSIKAVMDSLKGICGIVLVGANEYMDYLQTKADKQRKSFPQIVRRIKEGGILKLFSMTNEDVESICKELGVTSKDVINHIAHRCTNISELGAILSKLIKESEELSMPTSVELLYTIIS